MGQLTRLEEFGFRLGNMEVLLLVCSSHSLSGVSRHIHISGKPLFLKTMLKGKHNICNIAAHIVHNYMYII